MGLNDEELQFVKENLKYPHKISKRLNKEMTEVYGIIYAIRAIKIYNKWQDKQNESAYRREKKNLDNKYEHAMTTRYIDHHKIRDFKKINCLNCGKHAFIISKVQPFESKILIGCCLECGNENGPPREEGQGEIK